MMVLLVAWWLCTAVPANLLLVIPVWGKGEFVRFLDILVWNSNEVSVPTSKLSANRQTFFLPLRSLASALRWPPFSLP